MIEIIQRHINDVNILTIGTFDIYKSIVDRIYLKKLFHRLFSVGDEVFFFFRRKEDLTDNIELALLDISIIKHINEIGEFKYLYK